MINFNNFGKNYVWKIVAVAGVLAFMLAGQVSAQPPEGKGKGPRASLLSSTECALVTGDPGSGVANLMITTTLTNKSSGNIIAEVRNDQNCDPDKPEDAEFCSRIEFTQKLFEDRGNVYSIVETRFIDNLPISVPVNSFRTFSESFPLCEEPLEAIRELNGLATIFYGISGEDGETRSVVNRCTDDVDGFGGGIKMADVLDRINAACGF